jgi:anaerobic dimethyl sulfoxide reductase subunit B (iron-sulfur subunit)
MNRKQLAFYFNGSACTGCKTCQVACKDKNDNPIGVNFRRVIHYSGGSWVPHPTQKDIMIPDNIFVYTVSISCNHCSEPLCVENCPDEAITKRNNGIVFIDDTKCIGCRQCEEVCPYSAPQFNEKSGMMTKCDFCEDLLAQGKPPECVAACPQRALEFGELEELQLKHGKIRDIEPLPKQSLTFPSLVITPHCYAVPSGQGKGKVKMEEPMVGRSL